MTPRRRRRLVVLAELVLSPRVLAVLAVIVAFALLGLWHGVNTGNPCSPGYRQGSTGNLAWMAGPCVDTDTGHGVRCEPVKGVTPSPAPFALPSCVKDGGPR